MNDEEEQPLEPDYDYLYDSMRDDFLMIENEQDAQSCVDRYSIKLCRYYLPSEYMFMLNNKKEPL